MEYRTWLIKDFLCAPDNMYHILCVFDEVPFEFALDRDRNRKGDCDALRDLYYFEASPLGFNRDELSGRPYSILEIMAGLAYKADLEIVGMGEWDTVPETFAEMLNSIGLLGCSDLDLDRSAILDILRRINTHSYEKNGAGGFFTISNPTIDMRKTELWRQMNYYLVESRLK